MSVVILLILDHIQAATTAVTGRVRRRVAAGEDGCVSDRTCPLTFLRNGRILLRRNEAARRRADGSEDGSCNSDANDTAVGEPQAITRLVATRHQAGVTYSLEWTRCGKVAAGLCQQCAQQRYGHGPYWYARFRFAGQGRVVNKYIGKQFRQLTAAEREVVGYHST
jgi:hypothetical protein